MATLRSSGGIVRRTLRRSCASCSLSIAFSAALPSMVNLLIAIGSMTGSHSNQRSRCNGMTVSCATVRCAPARPASTNMAALSLASHVKDVVEGGSLGLRVHAVHHAGPPIRLLHLHLVRVVECFTCQRPAPKRRWLLAHCVLLAPRPRMWRTSHDPL